MKVKRRAEFHSDSSQGSNVCCSLISSQARLCWYFLWSPSISV